MLKPNHSNENYYNDNELNKNYNILPTQLGKDNFEINKINLKRLSKNTIINTTNFKKIKLQNEISDNNVLTIRYCNNPFICENLASNKISNDYQVNFRFFF